MSIAAGIEHGNELSTKEGGSLGRAQVSSSVSSSQAIMAEAWGMSAYERKMVVLTLLLGVLFLGSLGAYVWYGTVQFLKLP
jgi:hypothetical protein